MVTIIKERTQHLKTFNKNVAQSTNKINYALSMYLDTTLQRTNFESTVHVASSMCLSLIHCFVPGTDIHGII